MRLVPSALARQIASAQAGATGASGVRRRTVPIITTEAPRVRPARAQGRFAASVTTTTLRQTQDGSGGHARAEAGQTGKVWIMARGRQASSQRKASVIGRRKRRGPAAPGFSQTVPPVSSMPGL